MTTSITAKLFAAVLATAAFAVLAMGFAAHWSFERGFVGYLNEQAALRMDTMLPGVEAAYRQHGDWQYFRDHPEEWWVLIRGAKRAEIGAGNADDRPPPQVSDLTGGALRLGLLDEQGRVVIGYPQIADAALRREISVGGRTVGWLVQAPFQSATAVGDVRFQQSQTRASWTIGAVCMGLAAFIALWVARILLRPIKRVAQATHAVAAATTASGSRRPLATRWASSARDFNRMADTLERNEKIRRDFMADVSHELRQPLAILHGELEAMEDGVRSLGPAGLKSLQAEVATMTRLVNDLHDVSLAHVDALSFRKFELDVVAAGADRRRELPATPGRAAFDGGMPLGRHSRCSSRPTRRGCASSSATCWKTHCATPTPAARCGWRCSARRAACRST